VRSRRLREIRRPAIILGVFTWTAWGYLRETLFGDDGEPAETATLQTQQAPLPPSGE